MFRKNGHTGQLMPSQHSQQHLLEVRYTGQSGARGQSIQYTLVHQVDQEGSPVRSQNATDMRCWWVAGGRVFPHAVKMTSPQYLTVRSRAEAALGGAVRLVCGHSVADVRAALGVA